MPHSHVHIQGVYAEYLSKLKVLSQNKCYMLYHTYKNTIQYIQNMCKWKFFRILSAYTKLVCIIHSGSICYIIAIISFLHTDYIQTTCTVKYLM